MRNEIEERRKRVGYRVWNDIEESQSRQSRALMGLRSTYPRGGVLTWGGVRSVECIIGAPVGIEKLPSRAEECGQGGLECGMR